MPGLEQYLPLAVALVLLLISLVMVRKRRYNLKHAVEVQGRVEDTRIERAGHKNNMSKPVVEHTYTYRGRSYTSTTVFPSVSFGTTKIFAQNAIDRFEPGQSVTVYVNRKEPSRSFLLKSYPVHTWAVRGFTVLGLLFAYFGLVELGLIPF